MLKDNSKQQLIQATTDKFISEKSEAKYNIDNIIKGNYGNNPINDLYVFVKQLIVSELAIEMMQNIYQEEYKKEQDIIKEDVE